MSLISFNQASDIVNRFISLLQGRDISPAIGTKIEDEFLSPLELLEFARCTSTLPNDPELLSAVGGMCDLAAKVLSVKTQPEFHRLIPHLELFKDGATFASAVQTHPHDSRDDTNRKLSELYFGSLAIHIGHDVQLDHPAKSNGDNPDVTFTLEYCVEGILKPKSKWALAIKSVSTKSGQTIFENIKRAGKQIDADKCNADFGMVVINLKGPIDYAQLWGNEFDSLDSATDALKTQIINLVELSEKDRPLSDWQPIFAKRTVPIILYFAQAVVKLSPTKGNVVPTILKIGVAHNPLGIADPVALTVADKLNHYMQSIHLGIPGDNNRQPT